MALPNTFANATTATGAQLDANFAAFTGSSGSSNVGFIQSGTGAVARTTQDKVRDTISVNDFGAVGDGVDTGTTFTGTDNTAAFQNALNYCGQNGLMLYIPAGKYRFAPNLINNTGTLTLSYSNHIIIGHGAELLIDDDSPTSYSLLDFIRSSGWGGTSLTTNELLKIVGVTFRGRWSHSNTYAGPNILTVSNFKRLELINVKAYDLRAKFSRSEYCNEVIVENFHGERIASDCLRFVNCPRVTIDNPTLINIDDNCIAIPTNNTDVADVRQQISISNVVADTCVGILVLGARNLTMSNVSMRRSMGNAIYVGGASGTEGDTTPFNIILDGITIADPLGRSSGGSNGVPPTVMTTGTEAAIIISGIESSAITSGALPGHYDSVALAFVLPYALDNNSKPIFYNSISASNTVSEGRSFSLSNFSITRTLPNVASYSLWGFGQAFSRFGFYNPAITDQCFSTNAVQMNGQISDVVVGSGAVMGFPLGAAVYLKSLASSAARLQMEFKGVIISGITAEHVRYGVAHSAIAAAASFTWDVKVSGCKFNCDPYHINPCRTSPLDGSWNSAATASDRPYGIYFTKASGWTIHSCEFQNCYMPVLSSNTPEINSDMSNNILRCQPVALGFSASNKGIGTLPASVAFRYVIVDSTPASATYEQVLNHCVTHASAVPSSGTYVTGHFVWNTTPTTASSKTVIGWVRQTVGANHVVATTTTADWAPITTTTA